MVWVCQQWQWWGDGGLMDTVGCLIDFRHGFRLSRWRIDGGLTDGLVRWIW